MMYPVQSWRRGLSYHDSKNLEKCAEAARRFVEDSDRMRKAYDALKAQQEAEFFSKGFADLKSKQSKPETK